MKILAGLTTFLALGTAVGHQRGTATNPMIAGEGIALLGPRLILYRFSLVAAFIIRVPEGYNADVPSVTGLKYDDTMVHYGRYKELLNGAVRCLF